jgi:hypothetical protein
MALMSPPGAIVAMPPFCAALSAVVGALLADRSMLGETQDCVEPAIDFAVGCFHSDSVDEAGQAGE